MGLCVSAETRTEQPHLPRDSTKRHREQAQPPAAPSKPCYHPGPNKSGVSVAGGETAVHKWLDTKGVSLCLLTRSGVVWEVMESPSLQVFKKCEGCGSWGEV